MCRIYLGVDNQDKSSFLPIGLLLQAVYYNIAFWNRVGKEVSKGF